MLLILVLIFLLLSWLISLTILHRQHLSIMDGMMVAMGLAMSIGIYIGVLLGTTYPDQYVQVSFLAMLIGLLTGFLSGLPTNISAVLDGWLAGIMGGMMGVMFGVMIPSEQVIMTMKILSVLTAGIFFLLFLILTKREGCKEKKKTHLYDRPFVYFCFILLFLTFTHHLL